MNDVSSDNFYKKLENFLIKIFTNCDDASEIISLEPFLNFIQYFPEKLKKQTCKNILSIFIDHNQ